MSDEEEVLAAQEAKFAAQVDGDLDALAALLDDRVSYVHANGEQDDKAAFLRSVAERGYLSVTRRSAEARLFGDVAVITGLADIHITRELRFDARFTDVWQRRDAWRNLAWQSSRVRG